MNLEGAKAQGILHDQSPVMFAKRATWEGLKLTTTAFGRAKSLNTMLPST